MAPGQSYPVLWWAQVLTHYSMVWYGMVWWGQVLTHSLVRVQAGVSAPGKSRHGVTYLVRPQLAATRANPF